MENFFSHSIKFVQTDGGGEFVRVQELLMSTGVAYRQTCPHTHHQNGSVERKLHHIIDAGFGVLAHFHAPSKFGMMLLIRLAIWLIIYPLLSRALSPHLNYFSIKFQILIFSKCLDVNVVHIFDLITLPKCLLDLCLVCSWDIANLTLAINASIFPQVKSISRGMLSSMGQNFLFNCPPH